MASREELLHSIQPDMKLDKNFFMKIYGYELTWPGFAEMALTRLTILGCIKAKEYYSCLVIEYEHQHEKVLKGAALWYRKQCEQEFDRKKVSGSRRLQEVEQRKEMLLNRKKQLLMKKSQLLKAN